MGALTILITGAAGFIGRHVVADAQARGHAVIAVTRGDVDLAAPDAANRLRPLVARADAVIHCAASMTGAHESDTIQAQQSLLTAFRGQNTRLVLVSSIAVYAPAARIDERNPVEDPVDARDSYVRAKRVQEEVALEALESLWILRPGAVYGPGRLWNAHVGHGVGPVLLRMSKRGQLPLCHIARCAQALVKAAERTPRGAEVLNILDDDLPDRTRFIAAMRPSGWPRVVLPVHWRALMPVARLCSALRLPAPGLLRPRVLQARMMETDYDGSRAVDRLELTPTGPFEALIAQPKGAAQ